MTIKIISIFAFLIFLSVDSFAQTNQTSGSTVPSRPRIVGEATPTPSKVVIVSNDLPSPTPTPVPRPTATPQIITAPIPSDVPTQAPVYAPVQPQANYKILSFAQIKNKIAEAKRIMQSRPMPTALTDSTAVDTGIVRVAFYDWKSQQIDFFVLPKTIFLKRDAQVPISASNGRIVNVRIIRANGVNTPVTIFDQNGEVQTPLLVQYPVERGGRYMETAYYVSTHTGIVTPEVVAAGKLYVRNTIDIARETLRKKGINISAQIADMAERLATVEHVDHWRFRNEHHPNIYNDIFTLYALNEGQTYRYSVSSAGAGGMVQMIPSTYFMVRNRYYSVGLMPDFVEGMRNHANAAQAMLLYMQMTWDDLIASDTVYNALQNGVATPQELMAAGYNSNPARLAGYIRRGGTGWRNLIPRETRIYLQIYASLEKHVPMTARTK
jgi:hypothetical protein